MALDLALKLTVFLPRKLKFKINIEKDRINKRINSITITSYHRNLIDRELQRVAKRVANEELEAFVDKITTLLDENRMLTQSFGLPTISHSMKDLQSTVDKARYDKEHEGE